MSGRTRHVAALVLMCAAVLTACVTGERPTLVAPPTIPDDPVAAAVLERLERGGSASFTATYDITPTTTGVPTAATVVQAGDRRRTVIGTVEYLRDGSTTRTCFSGDVECTTGFDETRISNLNITHEFWGRSAAARLSLEAGRAVGTTTGRTETIAGVSATCADVVVPAQEGAGTLVYCAIDAGPLALYNGADVRIELTSFTSEVDESMLAG
jgi:hypothetical protein